MFLAILETFWFFWIENWKSKKNKNRNKVSGSEDEDFSENSSIRRQNVRRILSETRTMPEFSNSDESEMDYESAEENWQQELSNK